MTSPRTRLHRATEKRGDDALVPIRVAAYVVSGIGFIGGGVILKEGFSIRGLNTAALHSEDEEGASRVKVRAQVKSTGRKDELLEQIVTRLSLEPGVTTIRWDIASALDVGEDRIERAGPDSFDESRA